MSDPTQAPPAPAPAPSDLSAELTRSLSNVWRQNAGAKPASTTTEHTSDRVKFVLADAVGGEPDEPVGDDELPRSTDSVRYKNEAIAAVTRITGRKVRAYIARRDAKTDVASDTYILEGARIKR